MTDGSLIGAVGVDIGGTTIKAIAVDREGTVLARSVHPTPVGGDAVYETTRRAIAVLVERIDDDGLTLSGIGLASPGLVDARSGLVRFASNLGWENMPLADRLSAEFAVPVAVDNDARTGALAEQALLGPGVDLVFVPIGTGVSAAISARGEFIQGATHAAGEFGHLVAVEDGDPCTCGASGCIEAYASASSIVARYRRLGGADVETAEDVERVVDTDPIARRVWDDAVDALARGIASIAALLDPARVVVGGGLSLAGDALLEPVRIGVAARLAFREPVPVTASSLRADSALVGAALLGLRASGARSSELVEAIRAGLDERDGVRA